MRNVTYTFDSILPIEPDESEPLLRKTLEDIGIMRPEAKKIEDALERMNRDEIRLCTLLVKAALIKKRKEGIKWKSTKE